jgi:hypothetical protein
MTPTIRAYDLGPFHTKRSIGMARNSTGDIIEIRRPATSRLEFVVRFIQRRVTSGASINTGIRHVLVIFARERGFGALVS